jgi:uncharacterized membrane protein YhhN
MDSLPLFFVAATVTGAAVAVLSFRLERRWPYAVAKSVASLGFIGTAVAMGALDTGWTRLALGALVASATGDVALTVRGKGGFIAGLSCFALAHSVYVSAFVLYGVEETALAAAAVLIVPLSLWGWRTFRGRLSDSLRVPVGVYLTILSTMVITGIAAGTTHRAVLLVCGVVLVAGSDIAVARERFGRSMLANKMVGLPAYYAGQTLIALSLAAS